MAVETKAFAYLAIKKGDDTLGAAHACGDKAYIDGVVARWRSGEEPKAESADTPVEPELPLASSKEAALAAALKKAVEYALSQSHLLMVSGVAPALFSSISMMSVLNSLSEHADKISADNAADIYALSYEEYLKLERERKKVDDLKNGLASIPSAVLLSFVATFDALIVDVLGKLLSLDLLWMQKSERTLAFSRMATADDLDELIREAISEELYLFSRNSHDEQAKYIESMFSISIRSQWKRWPDYIEVFERRNLIAHGERRFNKRYVSVCDKAGHKGSSDLLGKEVELRRNYLSQALDRLTEFSILLPFALWRKIEKQQEEKAFDQLNEAAYTLIQNERYVLAERVLDFALSLTKVDVPVSTIHMLTINRASALRHAGHIEQAEKFLDGVDWSASSDLFRICMLAVRADVEGVAELIGPLKAAEKIGPSTIRVWPCFSFRTRQRTRAS